MNQRRWATFLLVAGTLAACAADEKDQPDAIGAELAGEDTARPDVGGADQGVIDLGKVDPGQPDLGKPDLGQPDLGQQDLGQQDLGPADGPQPDLGTFDTGFPDQGQPGGTGTCIDIIQCLNDKACETQACVNECLAVGSPEAQNQLAALAECQIQKCSQYGEDEPAQAAYCLYSQCKEQNKPCTKTGNLGCMAMLQCAQACGQQNEACILDCFTRGTYDAQTTLFALAACIEQKCPDNPTQQCIISNCMQQVMACQSS